MAIIIPSKNIYGDIDNPKIIDNKISKVSIEKYNVIKDNQIGVKVYSNDIPFTEIEQQSLSSSDISSSTYVEGASSEYLRVALLANYIKTTPQKVATYQIIIPKVGDNHRISSIEDNSISIQKIYTQSLTSGYVEGAFRVTSVSGGLPQSGEFLEDILDTNNYSDKSITMSSTDKVATTVNFYCEKTSEFLGSADSVSISLSNNEKVPTSVVLNSEFNSSTIQQSQGNIKNYNSLDLNLTETDITQGGLYIEENDKYTFISIDLVGSINTYYAISAYKYSPSDMNILDLSLPVNVVELKHTIEQVTLTIKGDTIGIDLTNGSVTYGSGSNPFSLTRNELLQDGAKTFGVPTTQYLAERIIEQYKRGKETATILCSVSDYYDEVGAKIISIDTNERMTFKEHDIVIPMVYGANGEDRPMSLYHDGRPKKFQVVQTEKFYDGAVWQKLTLQEYNEE